MTQGPRQHRGKKDRNELQRLELAASGKVRPAPKELVLGKALGKPRSELKPRAIWGASEPI